MVIVWIHGKSLPYSKRKPYGDGLNCLDNSFVKPNSRYVVEGKGAKNTNTSKDGMPHPIEKGNGEFLGGEWKDKVDC